jgi:hypothetical protein
VVASFASAILKPRASSSMLLPLCDAKSEDDLDWAGRIRLDQYWVYACSWNRCRRLGRPQGERRAGVGPRAEHARWWIDNFFVTGFCCAMVWVVCLVVVGGVASAVGPAGGVLLIPAIAAAFFTARSTWRESLPPAGPAITAT